METYCFPRHWRVPFWKVARYLSRYAASARSHLSGSKSLGLVHTEGCRFRRWAEKFSAVYTCFISRCMRSSTATHPCWHTLTVQGIPFLRNQARQASWQWITYAQYFFDDRVLDHAVSRCLIKSIGVLTKYGRFLAFS